ncbi:MAG TPA: carboxypeptidase-like regulatory domain-containing protein, partial [Candidatus Limnocylindria bacterium]|nr:carboxypeptidase-like regulatory domain-containing protein [Candidatus Limnocylindria bacterium]
DETGSPLPPDSGITGTVVAGPTCPVVTDPPDPSCADQPVADAELVITTPEGSEVARTMSDADGTFGITLAPGNYWLVARPVEGLMGTPEPQEFSVVWGMPGPELVVAYDTGIR